MGPPFGGQLLTFRRLLAAIGARKDCAVSVQVEAGVRFHFIEVHHPDHVVAPSRFHTICERLGIDEGELRRQALEIE